MPREIITVQVGQCGNQIGMAFWDLLRQEQNLSSKTKLFDMAMSSFFKNYDEEFNDISKKPNKPIHNLKARSIIVDTEEGVINQIMKGKNGDLFDELNIIKNVSGAGNNWAHGYGEYGPEHHDEVMDKIRREVEEASSLQCFLLFHSIGGGTGSGFGSYIIEQLADYYPEVFKFTASVFPSHEDDVITSPYNSVLATNKLIDHADCVFPIDNDSLLNLVNAKADSAVIEQDQKKEVFGKMNSIIGHLLSNLTCSMRFEGRLNIDLNEITMNMVPFPKLHFLISSMSPLQTLLQKSQPRKIDQIFDDVLLPQNQLVSCKPHMRKYLALGLMLRGAVSMSDVSFNIEKIKKKVNMIWWNQDGFKYGICDEKPSYNNYSLLCLANNTAITDVFEKLDTRFNKLFKKKVYVHHYTQYISESLFDEAIGNIQDVKDTYFELDGSEPQNFEFKKYKRVF